MKSNWVIKKLGEVCDKASSNVSQNQLDNESGKYSIFGASGLIKNVSFYHRDKPYISIIKDGAGIGRLTLQPAYSSVIGTLQYLIPKKEIDISYLYYFLQRIDFNKHRNGATIPHIYFKDYSEEEIGVPPLATQKLIVFILDKSFKKIAKAKENAEKNLKNAKELFDSHLQSVFENKGKGWEERMLKEIGITQTGTTPKTIDKKNYGDFIPFITPADIDISGNGEIQYDSKGLSEQGLDNGRKMLAGSILMVCIGATIGKVGFIDRDVSCNQQINSLTVKKEFSSKFIYYALSTKSFFEQVMHNAAQATLPIINKGKWETLIISFPKSLQEQQSIVSKLDALSAETKKLEAIYQQKLKDLEELKKSILQKAFNGELVKE